MRTRMKKTISDVQFNTLKLLRSARAMTCESTEVPCSPCPKLTLNEGMCGSTIMVKTSTRNSWCPVCGTHRELGSQVLAEDGITDDTAVVQAGLSPRPTPPHRSVPFQDRPKHDEGPRSL